MPSLAERNTRMQGFTAVLTVLRLLTPLKMSYEIAKKRAEKWPHSFAQQPEIFKWILC
jgi:hypothetical protein